MPVVESQSLASSESPCVPSVCLKPVGEVLILGGRDTLRRDLSVENPF